MCILLLTLFEEWRNLCPCFLLVTRIQRMRRDFWVCSFCCLLHFRGRRILFFVCWLCPYFLENEEIYFLLFFLIVNTFQKLKNFICVCSLFSLLRFRASMDLFAYVLSVSNYISQDEEIYFNLFIFYIVVCIRDIFISLFVLLLTMFQGMKWFTFVC